MHHWLIIWWFAFCKLLETVITIILKLKRKLNDSHSINIPLLWRHNHWVGWSSSKTRFNNTFDDPRAMQVYWIVCVYHLLTVNHLSISYSTLLQVSWGLSPLTLGQEAGYTFTLMNEWSNHSCFWNVAVCKLSWDSNLGPLDCEADVQTTSTMPFEVISDKNIQPTTIRHLRRPCASL